MSLLQSLSSAPIPAVQLKPISVLITSALIGMSRERTEGRNSCLGRQWPASADDTTEVTDDAEDRY